MLTPPGVSDARVKQSRNLNVDLHCTREANSSPSHWEFPKIRTAVFDHK